jgi:SNF2 family DNA or RNA helicase
LQGIIDDPSISFFSNCVKIQNPSFYKGYKRKEFRRPDRIVSCEVFTLDKATYVYDLMVPFSHNYIVDHVWSHNTYCVLVSTEHQIKQEILKPGKTLIAGKLMTLETGWMEDAKKFTDLKVNLLWATKPGKLKKQKILDALEDDADVYLINHDGVRVYEKELAAKNFDKVVLDESTILKSFKGAKSRRDGGAFGKALANVAHAAKWRIVMSGTPAPNGPQDLWGQLHFLDPYGILLERDYNDFLTTFMRKNVFGQTIKDENGNDTFEPVHSNTPFKWVPKPGSIKKIGQIIEALAYRVKIEEHLTDLPEKSVIVRHMTMNRTQMSAYKEMKKHLETMINDELITVPNRLVSALKLRQITGGFAIDSEGVPQALKTNPKMDMLINMVREEIDTHLKIVIFAEYRWEIEQITSTFKEENAVSVYGGNSSAKNIKNVQQFINDPKIRIIVLHPKSAAHGITLTCANYLIFYSISHSAEDNYQCVARVYRASQKHPTFIYYLLMQDSIDTAIYDVLGDKIKNQADMIDQDEIDVAILGNL